MQPSSGNSNPNSTSFGDLPNGAISIQMPSVMEEAHKVRNQIIQTARGAGFDESVCFGIQLAIDEALSNAIKHGNRNDPQRVVHVTYHVDGNRLHLRIGDEGDGFDPDQIDDPTSEENLESPTGRGIFLMRAYMTSIEYNDLGNEVVLVFERGSSDGT